MPLPIIALGLGGVALTGVGVAVALPIIGFGAGGVVAGTFLLLLPSLFPAPQNQQQIF